MIIKPSAIPSDTFRNNAIDLTGQTALERLAALSLFVRWIDEAVIERAAE